MATNYHPIIEKVASQLVATTPKTDKALGMTEVGAKKLQAELEKYKSKPVELKAIIDDLLLFVRFLETELESPHAASAIKYIVGQLPDIQKRVAEAETKRTNDHVEKVGPQFNKFIDEPAPTEPQFEENPEFGSVSAKVLLRQHIR